MEVKVTLVPPEGDERSEEKATLRVYDQQGIQDTMGEIVLDSKTAETQIVLTQNGYLEMENTGGPVTVDGEQMAGVPDSPEEVKERKEKEDDEKVERARSHAPLDERILRAREEALKNPSPSAKALHDPAKQPSPPTAHAEHKDTKADLSKGPATSPGHQPTPPGVKK